MRNVLLVLAFYVGTGSGAIDWRFEPWVGWSTSDEPLGQVSLLCEEAATLSCIGTIDLSKDSRARLCANVTDGDVVATGPIVHPPVCLRQVLNGSLVLRRNGFVTHLSGLERLEQVHGDVILEENRNLVSVRGLDGLQRVTGHVVIRRNGYPISLTELDDLILTEAYFQHQGDSRVEDERLHFPRRQQQRTLAKLTGHTLDEGLHTTLFQEDELASLASMHGLGNLLRVGGDLVIEHNTELLTLTGLDSLEGVDGSIVIRWNKKLRDVQGIPTLRTVQGDWIVERNPSLSTLSGPSALAVIGGSWKVLLNERLTEIGDFPSLVNVGGNVTIQRNDHLTAISSPPSSLSLDSIGGSLIVEDNRALAALSGLGELSDIVGSLYIARNPSLTSLQDGLHMLQTVGGHMLVQGEFPDYTGLESLETVHGSLVVHSNAMLISLNGLGQLSMIGKDLIVHGNPELLSIADLSSLRVVGERIQIYENRLLHNVDGFLDALESVGSYARVSFGNGTILCPKGSGVKAGELPLIHDTTINQTGQLASSSYGNWCTIQCTEGRQVEPRANRMWECQESDLWNAASGPRCV